MGMATQHHINVAGVSYHILVGGRGDILISEMRDGDNHIGHILVFQPPGGGIGGLTSVELFHPVGIPLGNHPLGV